MHFHLASQTLVKNSRYTQPHGTCLCYKVSVHCTSTGEGARTQEFISTPPFMVTATLGAVGRMNLTQGRLGRGREEREVRELCERGPGAQGGGGGGGGGVRAATNNTPPQPQEGETT